MNIILDLGARTFAAGDYRGEVSDSVFEALSNAVTNLHVALELMIDLDTGAVDCTAFTAAAMRAARTVEQSGTGEVVTFNHPQVKWVSKAKSDQFLVALLDQFKAEISQSVSAFATRARAQIVGTGDPVKMMEYVDKAQSVDAILSDNATAKQLEEAEAEATRLGLVDAKAVAAIWKAKADDLREARMVVNSMERDALAAIEAAPDLAAIAALKDTLLAQAEAQLAQMLGGA